MVEKVGGLKGAKDRKTVGVRPVSGRLRHDNRCILPDKSLFHSIRLDMKGRNYLKFSDDALSVSDPAKIVDPRAKVKLWVAPNSSSPLLVYPSSHHQYDQIPEFSWSVAEALAPIAALNLETGHQAQVSCVLRSITRPWLKMGSTIDSCDHGKVSLATDRGYYVLDKETQSSYSARSLECSPSSFF
ncbi:uncharacterized protein ATNIH1004_002075 [Aspergillus tanneri]|uniref:Uncharacterized protein n=1 Tax=Aspergillus tanneri TaxID=1220188 RepID=A0A5M9M7H4_9EURO|nr:uncharacterized protein ATNIH1004_002075 [Aspergillus tanneri]KAA8641274.1 hypothetical protein ATNIH1004_002075 [Aspergillus tanneri]